MSTKSIGSLVELTNLIPLDPSASLTPGVIADVPSYQPPYGYAPFESDYSTMYQLAGSNITLVNQFMASYNKNSKGLPGDITDFVSQYAEFLAVQGVLPNSPPAVKEAAAKVAEKQLLDGFALSFQTLGLVLYDPVEGPKIAGTVFPNMGTFGIGNTADPDQMGTLNAMWIAFVKQYHWQPSGAIADGSVSSSLGFFQELRAFYTTSATITDGINVVVNNGSGGLVLSSTSLTPSFEQIYSQYFPAIPTSGVIFQQELANFQRSMLQQHGYFSPSTQYAEWVIYVQGLAHTTAPAAPTLPPTKVNILMNIFVLLTNMISALQNIAASQANRLALYTSWQKGYSDLLNQVPAFTGSSKDRLSDVNGRTRFFANPNIPDLETIQKRRQDEQSNFNASITQQNTAYSNTVSQDAKSLQSNVNQSTDAYNNQANTASTILQNIATILNSIFR